MLNINKSSWHYKVYTFNSQWWAAWTNQSDYHTYKMNNDKIGLCEYMRMILLWGPLAILSNIVPIMAVWLAFFMFPMSISGIGGVIWLFVAIGAFGASGVCLEKFLSYRENKKSQAATDMTHNNAIPDSGFRVIAKEFVISIKTKVCPILEVNDDEQ